MTTYELKTIFYIPNDYQNESYKSFAEMMKVHPEFEWMDGAQYHVRYSEE